MQTAQLFLEDEAVSDVVGICSHCNHTPVAQSAPTCPRCGGLDPFAPKPSFFTNLFFLVAAIVLFFAVVGLGMLGLAKLFS